MHIPLNCHRNHCIIIKECDVNNDKDAQIVWNYLAEGNPDYKCNF